MGKEKKLYRASDYTEDIRDAATKKFRTKMTVSTLFISIAIVLYVIKFIFFGKSVIMISIIYFTLFLAALNLLFNIIRVLSHRKAVQNTYVGLRDDGKLEFCSQHRKKIIGFVAAPEDITKIEKVNTGPSTLWKFYNNDTFIGDFAIGVYPGRVKTSIHSFLKRHSANVDVTKKTDSALDLYPFLSWEHLYIDTPDFDDANDATSADADADSGGD